jgi:hypothetical protein
MHRVIGEAMCCTLLLQFVTRSSHAVWGSQENDQPQNWETIVQTQLFWSVYPFWSPVLKLVPLFNGSSVSPGNAGNTSGDFKPKNDGWTMHSVLILVCVMNDHVIFLIREFSGSTISPQTRLRHSSLLINTARRSFIEQNIYHRLRCRSWIVAQDQYNVTTLEDCWWCKIYASFQDKALCQEGVGTAMHFRL